MEIVIGLVALTFICLANCLMPDYKDISSNRKQFEISFLLAVTGIILFGVFLVSMCLNL